MRLAPDEDLSAAEARAREALSALRAGAAASPGDEGRGTGDAVADNQGEAVGDGGAAEAEASAAENLARVEERRQREWLYRGYRRARSGWKRD